MIYKMSKERLILFIFLFLLFGVSLYNLLSSIQTRNQISGLKEEVNRLDQNENTVKASGVTDDNDDFWQEPSDSDSSVDSEAVKLYLELCKNSGADAVLLTKEKKIISEWYSERYSGSLSAMSSTKSITSLLCGIAVDGGYIALDSPIGEIIPEWKKGSRSQVTLAHLLSNTSGLSRMGDNGVGFVSDKNEFVLSLFPENKPGTVWEYSNEGFQLISPILEKVLPVSLDDFAQTELFELLAMKHTSMKISGKSHDVWTYADLMTTPRDLAKIGYLILQGGEWEGRQIISEAYLEEMLTPVSLNHNYGLGWWLYPLPDKSRLFVTSGYLNTNLYVFEKSGWVIVRMQAPRGSFSGEDESSLYTEWEETAIKALIGELDQQEIDDFRSMIDGLGNAGMTEAGGKSPQEANPSGNIDEILQQMTLLSRNGNEDKIISILVPLLKSGDCNQGQTMQASMTLALQYQRKRDYRKMIEMLDLARDSGVLEIEGYLKQSYINMLDEIPDF